MSLLDLFRQEYLAEIAQDTFQSISELLPRTRACLLQKLRPLEPGQFWEPHPLHPSKEINTPEQGAVSMNKLVSSVK